MRSEKNAFARQIRRGHVTRLITYLRFQHVLRDFKDRRQLSGCRIVRQPFDGAQQLSRERLEVLRRALSKDALREQREGEYQHCCARPPHHIRSGIASALPWWPQPWIEYPPSTGIAVPVIKSEAVLARNTVTPSKSSPLPQRAAGVRASTRSFNPGKCSRGAGVRSVSIHPGRFGFL